MDAPLCMHLQLMCTYIVLQWGGGVVTDVHTECSDHKIKGISSVTTHVQEQALVQLGGNTTNYCTPHSKLCANCDKHHVILVSEVFYVLCCYPWGRGDLRNEAEMDQRQTVRLTMLLQKVNKLSEDGWQLDTIGAQLASLDSCLQWHTKHSHIWERGGGKGLATSNFLAKESKSGATPLQDYRFSSNVVHTITDTNNKSSRRKLFEPPCAYLHRIWIQCNIQ